MKKLIALLLLVFAFLLPSFKAHAVSPSTNQPPTKVHILWDKSPDDSTNPPDGVFVTGYRVYIGTSSRSYSQMIDVGNTTNYVITNLTAGTRYFFAVTAYGYLDPSNQTPDTLLESDFSAELNLLLPNRPSPPINLHTSFSQVATKWKDVVAYVRRTWLTKPLIC